MSVTLLEVDNTSPIDAKPINDLSERATSAAASESREKQSRHQTDRYVNDRDGDNRYVDDRYVNDRHANERVRTRRKAAPLRRAVGRSFGKWVGILTAVLLIGAFGGPLLHRIWNGFNPMAERTVDRTGPALLQAMSDLHDYRAAEGQFQVTVDVEKDAKWLPAAIHGERVVLNAVGHVDAGVDFSNLDASAIVVDPKTKAVTITLPAATVRKAELDLAASTILQHKRGLFDRLGSTFGGAPSTDQAVYRLAETKLQAAAESSDLVKLAETNTRQMLTALVKGLGHDNVTITFAVPGVSVAPGAVPPAAL